MAALLMILISVSMAVLFVVTGAIVTFSYFNLLLLIYKEGLSVLDSADVLLLPAGFIALSIFSGIAMRWLNTFREKPKNG